MFITKGIISLFGNKSRSIDINNLPDIDSPEDVSNFLTSLKNDINALKFDENSRALVDFLIDVSEKYEIEKFVGETWIQVLTTSDPSVLQGLLDISLNISDRQSHLFDNNEFLAFSWKLLVESDQPMAKLNILKILLNLPLAGFLLKFLNERPERLNTLIDLIKEPSDYLRNECLLLVEKIGKDNEEISKLLAYEGIFDVLCEIANEEEDVIAKDSWKLMKTLLSKFNRDYIRETPVVFNTLSNCLSGSNQESIVEFLIAACSLDEEQIYFTNQKYFSRLLGKVMMVSFPVRGDQNLRFLKLLKIMLKNNSDLEHLTNVDYSDLLDLILTYCSFKANFEENFKILCSLVEGFSSLSENFISRVTCVPGYFEVQEQKPIFNFILNKALDEKTENLDLICRVLEVVLFNNEAAKQLAIHLPINLSSSTLLSKVIECWSETLVKNPEYSISLTRLLAVWVHNSIETCQKSSDLIFSQIPTIFKSLTKTGVSESLTALVLGIICCQVKSSEIRNLILSQIEYQDFKGKLEYLSQTPDLKKCSSSNSIFYSSNYCTVPLAKVYSNSVQLIIRYLVKGLTESAPKEQKDLAKLFEVHEAFSSIQYLRQGGHDPQLENTVRQLNEELLSKNEEIENLRLEIKKVQLEKSRESRRMVSTLISIQEELDLRVFELDSYKRENCNLKLRVERLTEELQIFSGRRLERQSELRTIEMKENLKIQVNENKRLSELIEKRNKEYEEALEVIGRLKSRDSEKIDFIIESREDYRDLLKPSTGTLAVFPEMIKEEAFLGSEPTQKAENSTCFEVKQSEEGLKRQEGIECVEDVQERPIDALHPDLEVKKPAQEQLADDLHPDLDVKEAAQDWFKPSSEQDALTFFNSFEPSPALNSLFQ